MHRHSWWCLRPGVLKAPAHPLAAPRLINRYDEIRDNMLGWDITDFGLGDFNTCGFGLITFRNGNQHNPKYKKVYAEKLLFMRDGMMAPMHFHWIKLEDTINRGGGTLQIKIYQDDGEGGLSDEDAAKIFQDRGGSPPYRLLCNEYPPAADEREGL